MEGSNCSEKDGELSPMVLRNVLDDAVIASNGGDWSGQKKAMDNYTRAANALLDAQQKLNVIQTQFKINKLRADEAAARARKKQIEADFQYSTARTAAEKIRAESEHNTAQTDIEIAEMNLDGAQVRLSGEAALAEAELRKAQFEADRRTNVFNAISEQVRNPVSRDDVSKMLGLLSQSAKAQGATAPEIEIDYQKLFGGMRRDGYVAAQTYEQLSARMQRALAGMFNRGQMAQDLIAFGRDIDNGFAITMSRLEQAGRRWLEVNVRSRNEASPQPQLGQNAGSVMKNPIAKHPPRGPDMPDFLYRLEMPTGETRFYYTRELCETSRSANSPPCLTGARR